MRRPLKDGQTPLVAAGRRGAAMQLASDSRGKPCDRGDHGQERAGHEAANHDGRQRPLDLGSGAARDGHREEAQGIGGGPMLSIAPVPNHFAPDIWHEYRVLVEGNHHRHWIGG
jgi:hypothetical protein